MHPAPHPARSLISDGRMISLGLVRKSCTTCGLASHAEPLAEEVVRSFYDGAYDLGAEPGRAEIARAAAHAALIAETQSGANAPRRVLEVGCGAGLVLDAMAARWPEATAVGLEAAPQLAARRSRSAAIIHQGFFEDLPESQANFDLIYAINVIEHAADPVTFLRGAADRLGRGGCVVLMAPQAAPPNLELLFADHIHSFTSAALALLAIKAGLVLLRQHVPSTPIGDFSVHVLARADDASDAAEPEAAAGADLAEARSRYLASWADLDDALAARAPSSGPIVSFGAGEASALIRAYAPRIWERIETLLVDEAFTARRLDKSVVRYGREASDRPILLAVHPRGQARLAERLRADGRVAISWDDLISR